MFTTLNYVYSYLPNHAFLENKKIKHVCNLVNFYSILIKFFEIDLNKNTTKTDILKFLKLNLKIFFFNFEIFKSNF